MSGANWLTTCLALFPEVTEALTGQHQHLTLVEQDLAAARRQMRVGPSELALIETHASWSYPEWWPRLSTVVDQKISLPRRLDSQIARREAVETLQEHLQHIEVTSVVLRFLRPDAFGIISPPVSSLLSLVAVDDHVAHYLRYVELLEACGEHYGLDRVADVDMALWTAAHLSWLPQYAALREAPREDRFFQELRLANLVAGLGQFWRGSDQQRLLLARTLLSQDFQLAALIAAWVYERILLWLADEHGVDTNVRKQGQTAGGAAAERLDRDAAVRSECQLQVGDLPRWWGWRRLAVHGGIAQPDTEKFVARVQELLATVSHD